MKTRLFPVVLSLVALQLAIADDFKTINGQEYKHATVSRVEPDGIVITFSGGIVKIPFTDLSPEIQKKYGYDPQAGVDDTLDLLAYFKQIVGQPQRTFLYGSSMGGHVVVSSLEQQPDTYSGAFSECGVVAGVREMDYLVGYAALGQYIAGLKLLPVTDIETYQAAVTCMPAAHTMFAMSAQIVPDWWVNITTWMPFSGMYLTIRR